MNQDPGPIGEPGVCNPAAARAQQQQQHEEDAILMDDEIIKQLADGELPAAESEVFMESMRILKAEDRVAAQPVTASIATKPAVVDEFVRSYLVRKGMNKTLRVFEEEWLELVETGHLRKEDTGEFPSVYAQNEYLNGQLSFLREEMAKQDAIAKKAIRNFERLSLIRDHHRVRDRQSTLDLQALRARMGRMADHYASFEPALRRLKVKYDTLFQEKSMACLHLDNTRKELVRLKGAIAEGTPVEALTVSTDPETLAAANGVDTARTFVPADSVSPPEREVDRDVHAVGRELDVDVDAPSYNGGDPSLRTRSATEPADAASRTGGVGTGYTGGGTYLRRVLDDLIPDQGESSSVRETSSDHSDVSTSEAFARDPTKMKTGTAMIDGSLNNKTYHFPELKEPPKRTVPTTDPSYSVDTHMTFALDESFGTHETGVVKMCVSSDDNLAITVGDDRLWHSWKLPSGNPLMTGEGHLQGITSADLTADSTMLATSSADSTARIWDFCGGRCVSVLKMSTEGLAYPECLWDCAWNWNGQCLAVASSSGTSRLFDTETSQLMREFFGHVDSVNVCTFVPHTNLLCTASSDTTVQLWDVRAEHSVETFMGHSLSVCAATSTPQGDLIASGDAEGSVHMWDMRTMSEVYTANFGRYRINDLAFDPRGDTIAAAMEDGTVRMANTNSQTASAFCAHVASCQSCHFSCTGTHLYTASTDGLLNIWRAT